jgi:hypothetical protein
LTNCFTFSSDSLFEYNVYNDIGGTSGKGTFLIIKDTLILNFTTAYTNATFKKGTIWKYNIIKSDSSHIELKRSGKIVSYFKKQ